MQIRKPQFIEDAKISCQVEDPTLGWIDAVADRSGDEASRELFNRIIAGEAGPVRAQFPWAIRNPVYLKNDDIDCEVEHPKYGWIPFTARADDPENQNDEQHIYQRLIENEVGPIAPATLKPLEDLREACEREIDDAATTARLRYISPNKDATYRAKQEELNRWITDGRPANPIAGVYPYIQTEAAQAEITVTEVAESIEASSIAWTTLDPHIEGLARGGKVKMRNTDDRVLIEQIFTATIDQLNSV